MYRITDVCTWGYLGENSRR